MTSTNGWTAEERAAHGSRPPMTRLAKKRAKLIASTTLGPVLFLAGVIAKASVSGVAGACNSQLGQFGQALDQQAAEKCAAANSVSDAGTWAIIFGIVFLIAGVIGLAAMNREKVAAEARAAKPASTPPAP